MNAPHSSLARLLGDLDALASFVEPATRGWTRRFPSQAYLDARVWLRTRMIAARLTTSIDAGGNLFGQRAGREDLPPIVIGSHSDSVAGGGRLDGAYGVLAALEVARTLDEFGIQLRHPLLVADYLAEEANDFGISCVGSRALATGLRAEWLARTVGDTTLAAALAAHGGDPAAVAAPLLTRGAWHACLELHIEQGPVLEARGAALAAVSGIVGIRRGVFELSGRADHAGTAPMALRSDALAAAAALTLALERLCRATPDAVGTVGRLVVEPNQANVVPERVLLTAEVRSLAPEKLELIWGALLAEGDASSEERGVMLRLLSHTDTPAALAPPLLLDQVVAACRSLDPHAPIIASGAGHDSSQTALVAPTAMLFVPSIGGRSHTPAEDTSPEHLSLGTAALLRAVLGVDACDGF